MSTYWYFECRDHTPALQSAHEFTQHTEDRWYWQGIALANQRPVEADGSYWSLDPTANDFQRARMYFAMNATAFLSDHPTCTIGLVNEYGERRDLPTEAP